MTAEPHPSDVKLAAFAAGTLDDQSYAIATHVRRCASCHAFVRAMEHVGGIVLGGLPPTSLMGGSLAAVMARLDEWTNGVSSRREDALPMSSSKADLVKLTHRQREVLIALVRRLSNNAAVVEETGEPVPMVQGVADGLAETRASCCSNHALSASTRGLLFSWRVARRAQALCPRIVFSIA